jgi:hypothetical protein
VVPPYCDLEDGDSIILQNVGIHIPARKLNSQLVDNAIKTTNLKNTAFWDVLPCSLLEVY